MGAFTFFGPPIEVRFFAVPRALRSAGKRRRAEALASEALAELRAIDPERLAETIAEVEKFLARRP